MRRALLIALAAGCAAVAPSTTASTAPPPPHPSDRTQMIEELDRTIATDRRELGLSPAPSSDLVAKMHDLAPAPVTEAQPASDTCHHVCELSDDICRNQENICRLSDELGDDDWAKGRCDAAKASCKEAQERCTKCS